MVDESLFQSAFEHVLRGHGRSWEPIGLDQQRLVAACIDWLTPERFSIENLHDPSASRAMWILDKLLPLDEVELFRRFNGYVRWLYTLHPHFRRSPTDMATVTQEQFVSGERFAVEAAWVETRPTDGELLGWATMCRQRGWHFTDDSPLGSSLATIEYCRRAPELERLTEYLKHATCSDVEVVIHRLMRLTADKLPRTEYPEPGLVSRVEAAGLKDLAGALAERLASPPKSDRQFRGITIGGEKLTPSDGELWELGFAGTVWTAQQTTADVERFASQLEVCDVWRLVQILPDDRPDVWLGLMKDGRRRNQHNDRPDVWLGFLEDGRRRNQHMAGFCEWCKPEHRHLLPRFFDDEHFDAAQHAFKRFLELAPREEQAELADDHDRPTWQLELVDRSLYAPPELRPKTYPVNGPGEIVFDLRESDPFEKRSRQDES